MKSLAFLLPFLACAAVLADPPPEHVPGQYPPADPDCYNPTGPYPQESRCKGCGKCDDCGAPSAEGGPDGGDDPLGPPPYSGTKPPAAEVEKPSTVIGTYHGGALIDTTDLKVPGALSGIPLEFTRYYNSRNADGHGDLMGHGDTWSHSYSWRLTMPGGVPRVDFASGRRLDFTFWGTSTYYGQPAEVYFPPAGYGERLFKTGDFWHLVMPGAAARTFERVVNPDSTVLYHLRESVDTLGNKLTYLTNSAARVTKASDSLGNHIDLTYSQIVVNRKAAVTLLTIASPPAVGWNELTIPAGQSFRWIQAYSAPNRSFEVSEIEFYKDNGSGGHTQLSGTVYGTGPASGGSARTFDKAFDGNTSTRFTFCRPNGGTAGIDLGAPNTASVTKIRYHIPSTFSGSLAKFVGMKFQGMEEQPQTLTVLSAVTASTGDSVEFGYGTYVDESIGQSHAVLENVTYRNAANAVTDEAAITWTTAQEGAAPSLLRSIEPRSASETPDISFDYYPGNLAVKGQVAYVLAGDPAEGRIIQVSEPETSPSLIAPDGGRHTIANASTTAFRPTSSTDAGGKTTAYAWSSGGFLSSKTTPAGATTYTRNGRGQILTMTTPDGLTVTHTYDTLGRLRSVKHSAAGLPDRTTTHTRNSNGRVTKTTYPDGSYKDYTYDDNLGLLTAVREKNGTFNVHTYDTTAGSPTAGLRLATTRGLPAANSALTLGETTSYSWHLPGNASGSPARRLASVTDPRGRTTAYAYDHAGRVTRTTYPDNSFREIAYDSFGNKSVEFDGVSLEEWTHDFFRRTLTHTDAALGITTYDYGLNGSSCTCYGSGGPTLVTSPAGRKTRRTYDLMGRLLTETRGFLTPDAATTAREYDTLGRTTKVTGPDGHETTYTHDPMGRTLTATADPTGLNLQTAYTHSPFGDTLTTTLPGGRTTTMGYDNMGRPVSMKDPLNLETVITYDLAGNRTAVTEASGTPSARTTGFTYDAYDRLITTTHPDTTTVYQTYHPGGDPDTTTDELGRQTSRDTVLETWQDSLGQNWTSFATVTVRDPAGLAHTSKSYGPPMSFTGGTRRSVSPMGRVSESYSDELGRTTLTRSGLVTPASTLAADVTDTVMTYDADGFLLTSTTDPTGLNLTTTYTPDGLARVKKAKDPLNRETEFFYDKRGNRLKTKLPDGREHINTYNALGRLKTAKDPKNQTIEYGYWYESGQTLTLKDAKNQTTTWAYNLRGQLLTKLYPNGDDHAYTYDTLGRMETHTTPKNEVCTYTYDVRDRQTLADWNTTTPDTARAWWANGLIKSIDNGVSKSDYAYSVKNELTSETQTLAGQAAKVVSYDYDPDGVRLQMNSPSGSPVDYEWTAKAQLDVISRDGPPPLANYAYDKAGRLDTLTHENGIVQDLDYDAASQLTARVHKLGGTTVSGHGYTLDDTSRRTAETFSDGTTPARTYGYDNADQVTSANYGSGLTEDYDFDPAGNRTTVTRGGGLQPPSQTYTTNSANQYTNISGFTSPPIHDANGNLTSQNGVTYTWDSENRLLSVSDGTTVNTFTYDALHRRVTKRTAVSGTVTNKVHYLYDGWNVIEERTNTDTTPGFDLTTFALTKTLTWGTDLSGSLQGAGGVGGLLMVEEITSTATTAYHFHYDGNGNVTEITDHTGAPAATYRYDAFGNTLVATGSYAATNRYRFSTKPLDDEIANAPLYYYGYRYYDPVTGRWPSRDPIEEEGGINLYGFVGNDGVNFLDLLGFSELVTPDLVDSMPTSMTDNLGGLLTQNVGLSNTTVASRNGKCFVRSVDTLSYSPVKSMTIIKVGQRIDGGGNLGFLEIDQKTQNLIIAHERKHEQVFDKWESLCGQKLKAWAEKYVSECFTTDQKATDALNNDIRAAKSAAMSILASAQNKGHKSPTVSSETVNGTKFLRLVDNYNNASGLTYIATECAILNFTKTKGDCNPNEKTK